MNIIEQNLKGDTFAIAWQDDGHFRVSVIDNQGSLLDELDVTDIIGTDELSKPISGQNEPMITCTFIQNDDLFISAYHRREKKIYHFTYSFKAQ